MDIEWRKGNISFCSGTSVVLLKVTSWRSCFSVQFVVKLNYELLLDAFKECKLSAFVIYISS